MNLTIRVPLALQLPARLSGRHWLLLFLILVATLASTVVLKVGPVQYLELIYFTQIFIVFLLFGARRFQTSWLRWYTRLGGMYFLFCVVALALAVSSLRFEFSYPYEPSFFHYPLIIAVVRSVELAASVFVMLWLADLFREDPTTFRFTIRAYYWTGVASAAYSLLSIPFSVPGPHSLGLTDTGRFRGFYNEGGPYGLYALSVILIGIFLQRVRWESTRRIVLSEILLVLAIFMSGSKSALLAVVLLLTLDSLLIGNMVKRVAVALALAAILVFATVKLDFAALLRTYAETNATYERLSHQHALDGNYIVGRVAGAFIVPRMIAAHPVTGVGWGNYGLVRNIPEYRGAAAFSPENDQPALGLFGSAAELGVPLTVYLSLLLFLPFILLWRQRAPVYIANLALLQPLAHICGAQLNLTYPWIVSSFALAVAYASYPLVQQADPKVGYAEALGEVS